MSEFEANKIAQDHGIVTNVGETGTTKAPDMNQLGYMANRMDPDQLVHALTSNPDNASILQELMGQTFLNAIEGGGSDVTDVVSWIGEMQDELKPNIGDKSPLIDALSKLSNLTNHHIDAERQKQSMINMYNPLKQWYQSQLDKTPNVPPADLRNLNAYSNDELRLFVEEGRIDGFNMNRVLNHLTKQNPNLRWDRRTREWIQIP